MWMQVRQGVQPQHVGRQGLKNIQRNDLRSCWTWDTGSQKEICAVIKLHFVGTREDGWPERQWLFGAMIKHDRIMRHGGLLGFKVLNRRLINSVSVNSERFRRCRGIKNDTRRPLLRVMNIKITK